MLGREERVHNASKLVTPEEYAALGMEGKEQYRHGFNDAMILVRHAFEGKDLGTWGFPKFVLKRAKDVLE